MEELKKQEYYELASYGQVKNFIGAQVSEIKRSFVAIGYYLRRVRDEKMYTEDGYANIWEFAEKEYGIGMSAASRWMSINEKFSKGGNSPILDDKYKGFGKSQLQEMLYLNDEQMEQVTPDMTKSQIRDMRKPKEESVPVAEEIPGQDSIMNRPELMPEEKKDMTREEAFSRAVDKSYEMLDLVCRTAVNSGDANVKNVTDKLKKLLATEGRIERATVTFSRDLNIISVRKDGESGTHLFNYDVVAHGIIEKYRENPETPEPAKEVSTAVQEPEKDDEPNEEKPPKERDCFTAWYEKVVPKEVKEIAGKNDLGKFRVLGEFLEGQKGHVYTDLGICMAYGNMVNLAFVDHDNLPLYKINWYKVRSEIIKFAKEDNKPRFAPAQEAEKVDVTPEMVEDAPEIKDITPDPEEQTCETCQVAESGEDCEGCHGENYSSLGTPTFESVHKKWKDELEEWIEAGMTGPALEERKIIVAALASVLIDLQEQEEPERPALPKFKNDKEREDWLLDYRSWGLWYRDEKLDICYYKYDFEDGSRLVVDEYNDRENDWNGAVSKESYMHFMEKGRPIAGGTITFDKKFCHKTESVTYMKNWLKEYQKKYGSDN